MAKTKKERITEGGSSSANVIQLTQTRRFGIDISDYIKSITNAENIEYTMRARLYDIYEDILTDPHLASVIQKRKSTLTSVPVKFIKKDGTQDDKINEIIAAPWFNKFLEDCLDAKMWGFSLFQFDKEDSGYLLCDLVARKHVDPIKKEIRRQQYDCTGIPFDNFYNLLLVGGGRDLGLLAKAAPYVIYKRNAMGDWSQFSELFGMPIREYTYDASDDDARKRLLEDAQNQGAASVYIHPNDATMRIVEAGGKQASAEVYSSLIDRCNSEISKLVLGNTLTTEAGENGTQALGTVQAKGEDLIKMADRTFVLNVLNYDLTDLFAEIGFDTSSGTFIFDETEDVNMTEQLMIVQGLYNMGLPISDDYLYEKFGIEKPKDDGHSVQNTSPSNDDEVKGNTKVAGNGKNFAHDTNVGSKKESFLNKIFGDWQRFFV